MPWARLSVRCDCDDSGRLRRWYRCDNLCRGSPPSLTPVTWIHLPQNSPDFSTSRSHKEKFLHAEVLTLARKYCNLLIRNGRLKARRFFLSSASSHLFVLTPLASHTARRCT